MPPIHLCLGMVGMLVRHSPTLKHALRNLILHLHLHDRGAVPSLSLSDGEARLSYTIYQPGVAATGQIYDLSAAVAYDVLRTVCGPDWRLLAVRVPHAKPQDLEPYRRVFGLTPCFDAEQMTLVFAADWLLQPVPGADPETFRSLEAQIDDLSGRVYGDLPSRVRRIACNLLHCGSGSLESAAEVLSVHPRTLDRRLQRFGTTYRQIRDECKQALASHLLVETELSIPEIADRLQYASVSAFTRAFGRWNGSAPAAWRASRRKTVS